MNFKDGIPWLVGVSLFILFVLPNLPKMEDKLNELPTNTYNRDIFWIAVVALCAIAVFVARLCEFIL